jgi:UDP-N-acetylglucosamine/UDP-N-acetylgalactosamine diphosphorylase
VTDLRDQLAALGQEHVLQRLRGLSDADADAFLAPLQGLDLATLHRIATSSEDSRSVPLGAEDVLPPDMVVAAPPSRATDSATATDTGEALLQEGRVGVLIVAGGMGTRLHWNHPKGTYPIGPVTSRSLFELFFQSIATLGDIHGTIPPLAIQTSPSNDEATRAYLAQHAYFGLPADHVRTFVQGTLPAWTRDGLLALDENGNLVALPDGHGGVYKAFSRHGIGAWMRGLGVHHVFYFQVDNALVPIADPGFLAAHVVRSSQMSTMVVEKEDPEERVGVLARVGDELRVIEYSEISADLAATRTPEGPLLLRAANTGMHAFTLDFLEQMGGDDVLPLHTAFKPVLHGDTEVEGVKMERFVFDALHRASRALVYQAPRADVFSAVKSAEGTDTPAAAREAMMAFYRRKVEEVGGSIPQEEGVELSPRLLSDRAALRAAADAREPGAPLVA